MDMSRFLQQRLLDDTSVTDVVGSDIYIDTLPPQLQNDPAFAYVLLRSVGGVNAARNSNRFRASLNYFAAAENGEQREILDRALFLHLKTLSRASYTIGNTDMLVHNVPVIQAAPVNGTDVQTMRAYLSRRFEIDVSYHEST